MIQQTTSLLRTLWRTPAWRDDLLTAFDRSVQNGASRSDAKNKLKLMIGARLSEDAAFRPPKVDLEQVNWEQVTEFLCCCFYNKRFGGPLPTIPPDPIWEELSDPATWGPISLHPQQDKAIKETVPVSLVPLEQKLLTQGGIRMVYRPEPDLEPLLSRGEAFDVPAELVPGEPRACHSNVAQLWDENREALAIVTGYALSEDGLWRQHSWLLRKQPTVEHARIIETTIIRVKYFGFILTESEAETFLEMNG